MVGEFGLVLDIVGFGLMLMFNPRMGMLEAHIDEILKSGESVLTIPDYSDKDIAKIKRAMKLHKLGIVLVILGFIFQLIHSMYPDLSAMFCLT